MTNRPDKKSRIFEDFQTLLTSSWDRFRRKIPGKKRKFRRAARANKDRGGGKNKRKSFLILVSSDQTPHRVFFAHNGYFCNIRVDLHSKMWQLRNQKVVPAVKSDKKNTATGAASRSPDLFTPLPDLPVNWSGGISCPQRWRTTNTGDLLPVRCPTHCSEIKSEIRNFRKFEKSVSSLAILTL